MKKMNESFNNVVAFYRKYGKRKTFSFISDISFEIELTEESADEILSLSNVIKSDYNQNIIEYIKIGKSQITPNDYHLLKNFLGEKAKFTFESVSVNGSFFASVDDLLSTFKIKKPTNFYVAEIDYASFDKAHHTKIKTYEAIIELINTLKDEANKICDHAIHNDATDTVKLIFLGESKLELDTTYGSEELTISSESINGFINDIKTDKGEIKTHHKERNQILKKSLFDLLKHLDKNSEKFPYLIQHIDELRKSYNSGLDLYLNEFSFSKFSDELSEKKISYIEKTNKVVSDIGLKLLFIPVIGIATKLGPASSEEYLSLSTALYAALMMLLIIYTVDSISQISSEIKNTFHYRKYRRSILTSGSIEDELKKAHSQLNSRLRCINFILFVFYLLLLGFLLYTWKGDEFLGNFQDAFIETKSAYNSVFNLLIFGAAGLAIGYLIIKARNFFRTSKSKKP